MTSSTERSGQKHRTREALLAGARNQIAQGVPVTVTGAATMAGISKATAYRYFRDPNALAAEAGLAVKARSYEEITQNAANLHERFMAISLYFFDFALDNETAFRQFLARSLEASLANREAAVGRRGARRVIMFERALEEAQTSLDDNAKRNLVAGLSAATGAEAMIALLDVVGMDLAEARETTEHNALVLIQFHLPNGG